MARILVIDDEDLARYAVRTILERAGHQVEEAKDGARGVARQREAPFDVVITDIIMPNREGIETIMDLRRDFPHTPVIAISGGGRVGPSDYLRMSVQLGARGALAKPFTPEELLEQVTTCLTAI